MDNSSFFKKKGIPTPSYLSPVVSKKESQPFSQTELNRISVFRHIDTTQPTTRYRIAKEIRMAYTTVRLIVRDLVFSGIVHEKIRVGENKKIYKILTVPKSEEESKNE